MLKTLRRSFSTRLSLAIMMLTVPIFLLSLAILYQQSRHLIRAEAFKHVSSVLNATMQQLTRNLMVIENATNSYSWMAEESFNPENLLDYSRRVVMLNPLVDGCSISAEPDMFKEHGRHFSAYTVREPDTILTVVEQDYEYFTSPWYKTPREADGPCWVVYDDADTLNVVIKGMLASYGMKLRAADGTVLGIISSDLSLLRLSKTMAKAKPYPNAYFMLTDQKGRYLIHPDSTLSGTKSIFDGIDPQQHTDIIALGHEMTEGKKGQMRITIDGQPSIVCYQPVEKTGWSLALVCQDSDVLAGYYRLTYTVIPLIAIGLLLILLLCYHVVAQNIRPLNQLLDKTQSIAQGNMEVHIPRSQRKDVIGRLQNSFAAMLQALNFHLGSVRYTTEQAQQRNEELEKAMLMAQDADRQKTTFIQNVSHQIRTPLNIIMGFSQVLKDTTVGALSDDEANSIRDMIDHNVKHLNRMLTMLYDSSDTGLSEELNAQKNEKVPCNDIAREAIAFTAMYYPRLHIELHTELDDQCFTLTNRLYLMRSLRELLYNTGKYSDGLNVNVYVRRAGDMVQFVVEDTGKGITEEESSNLFKFFSKADDLSEGLGLGLPLARRHARNLGGNLTYDADYHDGCRFILEIPLTPLNSQRI